MTPADNSNPQEGMERTRNAKQKCSYKKLYEYVTSLIFHILEKT